MTSNASPVALIGAPVSRRTHSFSWRWVGNHNNQELGPAGGEKTFVNIVFAPKATPSHQTPVTVHAVRNFVIVLVLDWALSHKFFCYSVDSNEWPRPLSSLMLLRRPADVGETKQCEKLVLANEWRTTPALPVLDGWIETSVENKAIFHNQNKAICLHFLNSSHRFAE